MYMYITCNNGWEPKLKSFYDIMPDFMWPQTLQKKTNTSVFLNQNELQSGIHNLMCLPVGTWKKHCYGGARQARDPWTVAVLSFHQQEMCARLVLHLAVYVYACVYCIFTHVHVHVRVCVCVLTPSPLNQIRAKSDKYTACTLYMHRHTVYVHM